MNHLKYVLIPTDLAEKKTVKGVSKNSKEIALSYMDKALYCYMKVKYDYFKNKGQDFFEAQDTISDYFSVSKRTLQRMIDKLVDAGLVTVKFTDRNNVYIVHSYETKVKDLLNEVVNIINHEDWNDLPFW